MASLSTASPSSWLNQGLCRPSLAGETRRAVVAGNLEPRALGAPHGRLQGRLPLPWSPVAPLQLPSEVHFSRQLSLLPVQLDGSTCDPLSHKSAHVPPQSLPVAAPFPRIKAKPRLWPQGPPGPGLGAQPVRCVPASCFSTCCSLCLEHASPCVCFVPTLGLYAVVPQTLVLPAHSSSSSSFPF